MSTRSHAEITARRAVWLGALGVVLAGLFGMQDLDSHGVPGIEATHAAMLGPETPDSGKLEATFLSAPLPEGSSAIDMGMDVTCMAILAVALLALQFASLPSMRHSCLR